MRRWLPWSLGGVCLPLLSACAAFWVDYGVVTVPSRGLEQPALSALVRQDGARASVERWTRETRVGLGGTIEATLWDPEPARARLAYEIALNHLGRAAAEDLVAQRWSVLYGEQRDRFAIDLHWRFDEQFIFSRRILDPATWRFELQLASGLSLRPLSVAVLRNAASPEEGFWRGEVRLWFPWRDQVRRQLVLGGDNRWVRLQLIHMSGSGECTWRFPGGW